MTDTKQPIEIRFQLKNNLAIVKINNQQVVPLAHPRCVYWFYDFGNGIVATTAYDDVIRVWNLNQLTEKAPKSIKLKGHTDRITNLLRVGDNQWVSSFSLCSASYDGKVIVWTTPAKPEETTAQGETTAQATVNMKTIYIGQTGFLDIALDRSNVIAMKNQEGTFLLYNLQTDTATRVHSNVRQPTFRHDDDLFNYLFVSSQTPSAPIAWPTRTPPPTAFRTSGDTSSVTANVKSFEQMVLQLKQLTDDQRTKIIEELDQNEKELNKNVWADTDADLFDYIKWEKERGQIPVFNKTETDLLKYVKNENKNHSYVHAMYSSFGS